MSFTTPPSHLIAQHIASALAEDIGAGDWTAQLIEAHTTGCATIVAREATVLAGRPWVDECFRQVDARCRVGWHVAEGEVAFAGTVLCTVEGPARALLTAERTALNFLQTLSATATLTRRFVDAVAGYKAQILDTRKTLPGLRLAQKYAVTVGGGVNQRVGLYDGVLIKENHILAAGGIRQAVLAAQTLAPAHVSIQVEVESLAELSEALDAGAKLILLDNMGLDDMRAAVQMAAGCAALEASGNVSLDTIAAIAATGVDRISIGKLTKDVAAVDLSMRFVG
jgi:nicotinate-nucleotide pyrophosphorylase (carboxylating)